MTVSEWAEQNEARVVVRPFEGCRPIHACLRPGTHEGRTKSH